MDLGGGHAERPSERLTGGSPESGPAQSESARVGAAEAGFAELGSTEVRSAADPRQMPKFEAATSPLVRPPEPTADRPPPAEPEAPASGRRRTVLLGLIILLLVLISGAVVGRLTAPGEAEPVTAPTTSIPVTATDAPIAPPPTLSAPTAPTRPADALGPWATRISAAVAIPTVAVQAYGYAQLLLQKSNPTCHLGWTTLAGIGEVASHHGQAGGAVLDPSGRSTPTIVGPALDGKDGRALVADTDAGAYDADPAYDRPMGPMMLLPATWRTYASDGDNDRILDPYDIDDASVALARLLCSGNNDLAQLSSWTAAVGRWQTGEPAASAVFLAADSYGQRTRNVQ